MKKLIGPNFLDTQEHILKKTIILKKETFI